MPADSTTLDEEGVVIAPRVLDEAAIDELVAQMRQPDQRRADLRAQLAANRIGAQRLVELAERLGAGRAARGDRRRPRLRRAAHARLHRGAARRPARGARRARGDRGRHRAAPRRDRRGRPPGPRLRRQRAQHGGNLNCPLAVTRSAAYFAVRVLTDPDVPPSAGAYRPIEVRAPEGSLLNARAPPTAARPPPRWRAATSRPPAASRTSSSPRSAARSARAR